MTCAVSVNKYIDGTTLKKTNMKTIVSIFFVLFANVFLVNAQQRVDSLVIDRTIQKIRLFQEYLNTISDDRESYSNRLHFANKALSLFIGKGDSYEENGVTRKGVVVEMHSITRKNADRSPNFTRRLMKTYINGVANLKYEPIHITGCIIGHVDKSSIHQLPDSSCVVGDIIYDTKLEFTSDGYRCYDISPHKVRCVVGVQVNDIKNDGIMYEETIPLYDIFGTYISNN